MKKVLTVLAVLCLVIVFASVPMVAAQASGLHAEGSPWTFAVNAEFLTMTVAALLSLAFNYISGLAEWYDVQSEIRKRQIMAGLLLVVSIGVFLGQCFSIFATNLTCTQAGVMELLYQFLLAVGVNQGIHALTKPSQEYKYKYFKTYKGL